jgi:hypothetical protein
MQNSAHHVVDVNPAPPLATVTHISACTDAKWGKHFRERATDRAQNQTEPGWDSTNSGLGCGLRTSFPIPAHGREKVTAGGTVFTEHFVATVAVVADSRGGDEDTGPLGGLGDSLSKVASSGDAALLDAALLGFSPPSHDALSGEVNHGVIPGDRTGIQRSGGVPEDFSLAWSRTRQPGDFKSLLAQDWQQGLANWPGSTGNEDSGGHAE